MAQLPLKNIIFSIALTGAAFLTTSCGIPPGGSPQIYGGLGVGAAGPFIGAGIPVGLIRTSNSRWFYDPYRRSYYDQQLRSYYNISSRSYYNEAPRRYSNQVFPSNYRQGRVLQAPSFRNNNRGADLNRTKRGQNVTTTTRDGRYDDQRRERSDNNYRRRHSDSDNRVRGGYNNENGSRLRPPSSGQSTRTEKTYVGRPMPRNTSRSGEDRRR